MELNLEKDLSVDEPKDGLDSWSRIQPVRTLQSDCIRS